MGWGFDEEPTDPAVAHAADNQVKLLDRVEIDVAQAVAAGAFALSLDHLTSYHAIAMGDLLEPGQLRSRDVVIRSTFGTVLYEPPATATVPALIYEACAYVNANLATAALHTAAYALWRINWIHPFADGNGRTARAITYLLVGVGLGSIPSGVPTVPEMIVRRRYDFLDALEAASRAWKQGVVDVSMMETFLFEVLEEQLRDA